MSTVDTDLNDDPALVAEAAAAAAAVDESEGEPEPEPEGNEPDAA